MKKTGIKNRIIAGILSAITLFSIGTIAATSGSAAERNEVTVCEYNGNTIYYSDDYFIPIFIKK